VDANAQVVTVEQGCLPDRCAGSDILRILKSEPIGM
jgi:hypothetical protein